MESDAALGAETLPVVLGEFGKNQLGKELPEVNNSRVIFRHHKTHLCVPSIP